MFWIAPTVKFCSYTQGNKWRDGNLVNVEWELTLQGSANCTIPSRVRYWTISPHQQCTSEKSFCRCIFSKIANTQNSCKMTIEMLLEVCTVCRYSCKKRQLPNGVNKMLKVNYLPSIWPYKLNCRRHYFPLYHSFHLNQKQVHHITWYWEHLTSLQA